MPAPVVPVRAKVFTQYERRYLFARTKFEGSWEIKYTTIRSSKKSNAVEI